MDVFQTGDDEYICPHLHAHMGTQAKQEHATHAFPYIHVTMANLKSRQIHSRSFCHSLITDLKPEGSETSIPGQRRWLTLLSPLVMPCHPLNPALIESQLEPGGPVVEELACMCVILCRCVHMTVVCVV